MTGMRVEDAGFFTTVQDLGRPGYREWGVPTGGAFDQLWAGVANALAANPLTCAVLELTMRGGVYHAECPLGLALAGAPIEAKIQNATGSERSIQVPSSFSIEQGERLLLGRITQGARTYLAARGGWRTGPRLGSRSTEEPITAGAHLPAEASAAPARRPREPDWRAPAAEPFRILDGPDLVTEPIFDYAFWAGRRFRVSSRSNRMGLRLEGAGLAPVADPERLSMPLAPGAIQATGAELIVLGVAGGTMGGYPHIAQVISADLDRLGQLRPGDEIEFRKCTLAQARALDDQDRARRAFWATRIALVAQDAL